MIDWPKLQALKSWKQRNAHVERAVRTYLAKRASNQPAMTTQELALTLWSCGTLKTKPMYDLMQVLRTLATHANIPGVERGGEAKTFMGKEYREWFWKGTGEDDGSF